MKSIKVCLHPDCTNIIQGRRSDAIYCSQKCYDSHRNKLRSVKQLNSAELSKQQLYQRLLALLDEGKNHISIDSIDLNLDIPTKDVIMCKTNLLEFSFYNLRMLKIDRIVYFRFKNKKDENFTIN